jgi:hypothetical protein
MTRRSARAVCPAPRSPCQATNERRPPEHSQRPEGLLARCAQHRGTRTRWPMSAARRAIANDPKVCPHSVLSTAGTVPGGRCAARRNICPREPEGPARAAHAMPRSNLGRATIVCRRTPIGQSARVTRCRRGAFARRSPSIAWQSRLHAVNWTTARGSAPSGDNARRAYLSRRTVRGSAGRVVSSTGCVPLSASVAPGASVTCVAEAGPRVPLEERVLVPARAADALAVELGERDNLGATSARCLEHCLRPLEGVDAPA